MCELFYVQWFATTLHLTPVESHAIQTVIKVTEGGGVHFQHNIRTTTLYPALWYNSTTQYDQ